jgi:hypothetical protein
MKKGLTVYSILSFCILCIGIMVVFLMRLPADETWKAIFIMASIAPTTIVSAVISHSKKMSFRIVISKKYTSLL